MASIGYGTTIVSHVSLFPSHNLLLCTQYLKNQIILSHLGFSQLHAMGYRNECVAACLRDDKKISQLHQIYSCVERATATTKAFPCKLQVFRIRSSAIVMAGRSLLMKIFYNFRMTPSP